MNTPFFSIVIPTRNRPQLLEEALKSALLQNFDDFEVVVSNNSTDEGTLPVLNSFRSHARLSVFRSPENLSMHDHWEFATQKASGRYVLILTDRSVLRRNALKTIYDAISVCEHEVLVCSWRWSLYDESSKLELVDKPLIKQGEIVSFPSCEVAQDFLDGKHTPPYILPRGLNSCYRSDFAAEIRKKHGALFVPISPDYTSAFLLLAHSEHVLFLDTALFISQGTSLSTGNGTYHSITASYGYINSLPPFDYYAHVPLKVPLVENLIFEDFLAIQEKAGGRLKNIAFNWPHYFVSCYQEIVAKKAANYNVSGEHSGLLLNLEGALSSFDKTTLKEVKKSVRRIKRVRKVKNFLKATPLGPFILYLNRWFDIRGKRPKSVLDHAGFDRTLHF